MGMDLHPVQPTKDAPRYPEDYAYEPFRGKVMQGRYNWTGWSYLIDALQRWGVSLEGFSGSNDGDLITAEKCREVADAIEQHLPELSEEDSKWLQPHIALWRTCGGYKQH